MNKENAPSQLPPNLLQGISTPGGGRVVLVLGAGCSKEEPTALPLASELSERCYQKLVADGVISPGDVNDLSDLSGVAEAVVKKTGSQSTLVESFPRDEFRNAEPNEGYLIMAALLMEGAIADVLTLNFDLAARSALSHLGAGASVTTIRGPEEHRQLTARNLIYLHRDIDSAPDDIILRTSKLEKAWQNGWEQVITERVLSGPTTVFVGLGSPASVLVSTMNRIVQGLGKTQTSVYVVDPLAQGVSRLASTLSLAPKDILPMGWGDFMRALAQRVVKEQRATVERVCRELATDLEIQETDVTDLCGRMAEIGLLRLGRLRAAWMLDSGSYLPHGQDGSLKLISNLVIAVRMVENVTGLKAQFGPDGLVEFYRDSCVARVLVCSGGGWMDYARISAKLSIHCKTLQYAGRTPSFAVVAGVQSGPDIATPTDITADADPDDIVTGPAQLRIIRFSELIADPSIVLQVIR